MSFSRQHTFLQAAGNYDDFLPFKSSKCFPIVNVWDRSLDSARLRRWFALLLVFSFFLSFRLFHPFFSFYSLFGRSFSPNLDGNFIRRYICIHNIHIICIYCIHTLWLWYESRDMWMWSLCRRVEMPNGMLDLMEVFNWITNKWPNYSFIIRLQWFFGHKFTIWSTEPYSNDAPRK